MTCNRFRFGKKNITICLHYPLCANTFGDHRQIFQENQAYASLIWVLWTVFANFDQLAKIANKNDQNLEIGNLGWFIEGCDVREYYNLGRVRDIIEGTMWFENSNERQPYKRTVVELDPFIIIREFRGRWCGGWALQYAQPYKVKINCLKTIKIIRS